MYMCVHACEDAIVCVCVCVFACLHACVGGACVWVSSAAFRVADAVRILEDRLVCLRSSADHLKDAEHQLEALAHDDSA